MAQGRHPEYIWRREGSTKIILNYNQIINNLYGVYPMYIYPILTFYRTFEFLS